MQHYVISSVDTPYRGYVSRARLYVRHLALTDFRSWPRLELELTPGRTVFVGPNGFGKTNIVEALWYTATVGSHRVASDAPLVRDGNDRAVVSSIVVNDGRELAVDLEVTPGRANKARLNRSPVRSAREILGVLRAVLFAPEDLSLVRGDPGDIGGRNSLLQNGGDIGLRHTTQLSDLAERVINEVAS